MKRCLLIVFLLGIALNTFAQDNPQETLIFIQDDTIQMLRLLGSGSTVLAEDLQFPIIGMMRPVVTSDGFAYFDVRQTILRVDVGENSETAPTITVTDMPLVSWLPIDISPDEMQLLLPIEAPDNTSELWIADLDGSNPQQIADIPILGNCGTDGVTPDILEYWSQTGIDGNTPLLAWVSDNQVLVSETCFGGRVFSVDLTTGEVTTLTSNVTHATVDTINQTLAGFICQDDVCNTIRLVDIATGDTQAYDSEINLDQLEWLPDGRLLISSISSRGSMSFTPVDEQLALDLNIWFDNEMMGVHKPDTLPLYETTLHIFDPETGDFNRLWTETGMNGIPVMTLASDGIFFSAINDLEAVATAMNNGEDTETVISAYPSSTIYFSILDGSPPVSIVPNAKSPAFFDN